MTDRIDTAMDVNQSPGCNTMRDAVAAESAGHELIDADEPALSTRDGTYTTVYRMGFCDFVTHVVSNVLHRMTLTSES
ncbi:MAG: hypothetical protein JWM90_1290 [Thermoleophilia bacterium]|nr:hypothetical protein [Thermoleophilia bacterium]